MNTLPATIIAVSASEHLSILTVSVADEPFHLLLAEQCHDAIGTPLTLAFKETEVILISGFTAATANVSQGSVRTLRRGEILTEVSLDCAGNPITALVPTLAFEKLGISVGESVGWMVQPSEISLLRETHGV